MLTFPALVNTKNYFILENVQELSKLKELKIINVLIIW